MLAFVLLSLLKPASNPVTDRATSSWPEIIKAASTNGYALFGLVVLVVGLGLLIAAKDWAKVVGALALIAGAIFVILALNGIKSQGQIVLSGTVHAADTRKPVHNATVTFQLGSNGAILTDHTDSDGLYRIMLDAGWLNQTGRAAAHKEDYEDADKNIVVNKTIASVDFDLPPHSTATTSAFNDCSAGASSSCTEPIHSDNPQDEATANQSGPEGTTGTELAQPSGSTETKIDPTSGKSYLYIPVTKRSGSKPSGDMANFSPWYDVCLDSPVASCTLESPQYALEGDRKCNAWSECRLTDVTPNRVCFSFRTQGHSEWAYPGQGFSEGVLKAQCKVPVNPKSPIVHTVSKSAAVTGRQISYGSQAQEELKVSLSAPGKIVYVEYQCIGMCSFLWPSRIEYGGDKATWYGMTNSGTPASLKFTVSYQ